jgi:hypothetical protein
MSLDKEEKPLGLKIINFIVVNVSWYLIFSLIYWEIDCRNWWLIQNPWGRALTILLELSIYFSSFKKDSNGKS